LEINSKHFKKLIAMKKTLVPFDFSKTSVDALGFSLDLASKNGDFVYVLHVIDLPLKQLEEESRKKFELLQKKYATHSTKIKFFVELGGIIATIQDFAARHRISQIVMGTHGASGMKEVFVGSNTEKVVRSSTIPVWAIRKYVKVSSIRNIVLPTSTDLKENKFMNTIKELQTSFKAKIHLLYVNIPNRFMIDGDIKQSLNIFKEYFKLTNVTLNVRSDFSEHDGIMRFTNEIKGNMIAMVTHGRKGLAHWLSGSVTEDVVNHLQCPIFTFHSKP
jgi:nucleotide-binding universal stress UspA family protein